MPFANNQGVQIYYEVEGQGPPIVLAHGGTGDTTFWRGYGYVAQLRGQHTIILFDARGHGRSDKPHDSEAYDYRLMVNDVIAILDELGIAQTHYWGYSMGGGVGLGLAKHHPERLLSLIAGGTDPLRLPAEEGEPDELLAVFRRGVVGGVDELVEGMKTLFGSITPQYEARLRGLDPKASRACYEKWRYCPSFADVLPHMTMPCLLYAGDRDGELYKNGPQAAQRMPNARFVSLPGLNHSSASAAIELVMPKVLAFLSG